MLVARIKQEELAAIKNSCTLISLIHEFKDSRRFFFSPACISFTASEGTAHKKIILNMKIKI